MASYKILGAPRLDQGGDMQSQRIVDLYVHMRVLVLDESVHLLTRIPQLTHALNLAASADRILPLDCSGA